MSIHRDNTSQRPDKKEENVGITIFPEKIFQLTGKDRRSKGLDRYKPV